ncbi:MAG: hypothetical protein GVY18_18855 [Bacteroidetes bacterium]|nr:hypothetical protein [Bacteroidota bacterium]
MSTSSTSPKVERPRVANATAAGSYRAFGLHFRSEMDLPELRPASDDAPDVHVRYGTVALPPEWTEQAPHGYQVEGDTVRLWLGEYGRMAIRAGEEIVVDPGPEGTPDHLRIYLLASAMGALLHQRGLLPLHASVVAVEDGCVAFLGDRGAGKSTLATFLHHRGYPLVADDVCALTVDDESPRAWPGIPQVKLWEDALAHFERPAAEEHRILGRLDKYLVPVRDGTITDPRPLRAVFVLEEGPDHRAELMQGGARLQQLIHHTYRRKYLATEAQWVRHFQLCSAVARAVPVYTLTRPRDLHALPETQSTIEAALST